VLERTHEQFRRFLLDVMRTVALSRLQHVIGLMTGVVIGVLITMVIFALTR